MDLDHHLAPAQPAQGWTLSERVADWLADGECSVNLVMTSTEVTGPGRVHRQVPLLVADVINGNGVTSWVRSDPNPFPRLHLFGRCRRHG